MPDELTPEKHEAYAALEAAFRRVFTLNSNLRDDEIVPHWALFAYIERPFAEDPDDRARYLMALPNGRQAIHITTGLFQCALDLVSGGWTSDDEEPTE